MYYKVKITRNYEVGTCCILKMKGRAIGTQEIRYELSVSAPFKQPLYTLIILDVLYVMPIAYKVHNTNLHRNQTSLHSTQVLKGKKYVHMQ